MGESNRLAQGGRINRGKVLSFSFNGQRLQGFEGDTLASAVLAAGVKLTARSFKYHRPRGITAAGVDEPSSMVEVFGDGQSASQPITTLRLTEGLVARSVNCWPSASFDLLAVNQLFSRLLPASFYYKTFMWPNWLLYEPSIRHAAGLARAPETDKVPGIYETRHWHCDVLIAGAGPAGLMAALAAGRAGCRVLLADEGSEPGGALLGRGEQMDGRPALEWVSAAVTELDAMPHVRRLTHSSVWAYREANLLIVTERQTGRPGLFQRTWRVRARQVVIATGATERPLVFHDNDRPGVMLASAVQTYLHRYAVQAGKRAVVFTNNSSAYQVAADMRSAGINVVAVVDARAQVPADALALLPGVEVLAGHVVVGTRGRRRIAGAKVQARDSGGAAHGPARWLDSDLLAMSGGWSPVVHLFSQSRGSLRFDDALGSYLPDQPAQPCVCAGAAAGAVDLPSVLADGARRGAEAAIACGRTAASVTVPAANAGPAHATESLWHVTPSGAADKAFVDLQHDVTVADVHLALREGYGAVEHVKRYTTAGMGIDQGKAGNINVIGTIAWAQEKQPHEVGMTTMRSPYVPVDFGALAGARGGAVVLPFRHTPMTSWNIQRGAQMFEAGARWRRPGWYPLQGEVFDDALKRECRAVREGLAMYDGSPLGKFEIRGPDTLKLLDMLYSNSFAGLPVGMGRYGLMLSDDGLIFDDGVSFRLDEDLWLMSTSTANADEVYRHMEHFLQVEQPQWRVRITPVTTAWANATVCGPRARELMAAVCTDIDFSTQAFPFMGLRQGRVAGFAARVARVSFTGELSYEINVRARDGLALWERLLEVGRPMGMTPVGSEASHVLRVEKGFLSLGHEVDGTVDAYDLGMAWAMSRTKPDYLGRRSVHLRRASGRPRRELVGLLTQDPQRLVQDGAPITPGGRREAAEGFVSASVWSGVQQRSIALGLLTDGHKRMGETVQIRLKDEVVPAIVVAPCFHDPKGLRLRG